MIKETKNGTHLLENNYLCVQAGHIASQGQQAVKTSDAYYYRLQLLKAAYMTCQLFLLAATFKHV